MESITKTKYFQLLEDILHGDEEHMEWLTEAFHCAWESKHVPSPRGSGTKDRLYREIFRLREEKENLEKRLRDLET